MLQRRLVNRLDEVTRRVVLARILAWLAFVWLLLALAGGLMLWMQAGWLSRWSAPLLVIAGLLVAMTVVVLARYLINRDRWLVGRLESRYPELDSRLRTAVQQQPDQPMGRLGFLQETVIREALLHDLRHPWSDLISTSRLAWLHIAHWIGLALCIAVVAQVFMVTYSPTNDSPSASGLARAVPGTADLKVSIDPGDVELERGTSLLVLARFDGRIPADATLVLRDQSERSSSLAMTRSLEDPLFVGRVADVQADLRYRVEYAGRHSETYSVTVFEYPELLRVDAELEFPGYTGLEKTLVEDTRRITAVEGTLLTLMCHLNKAVAEARLEADDQQQSLDLTAMPGDQHVVQVDIRLTQSQRYRLQLVDDKGRRNKVPPEIVINVLPNQPPALKLAWPRRDVQVSPLEELLLKAKATDDFGVRRVGVAYHLAGTQAKEVVLASGASTDQQSDVQHTVFFEDLQAQPDQLLSYYFWAEDAGPDGSDRRVFSDMYFAEVRRFEEIFRQGQQPTEEELRQQQQQQQQGQQSGQNAQQAERLADLQKQIINATWTLIRRETSSTPSESFLPDVQLLQESQQQALEQVGQLAQNVQDEQSRQYVDDVQTFMNQSLQHLGDAHSNSSIAALQPAIASQQSAYQALLSLRAREHEVVRAQRQQSQSSQSSSSSQSRNQQQLDQLELRESENRYETQSQAQSQSPSAAENQAQREERQILNRLRELAQRQADLNERIKELQSALDEAQDEQQREEIRRQLKRLRDEQQQILRDLDETSERMQQAQNQQEMREAQQQLREARNEVRQASEALEQERLSQAAAEGTRAGQRFEQLQQEFRQRTAGQFDEQMRQMRETARELDQRQQQLSEQIADANERQQRSLREDQQRQQIQQGLQQQGQQLGSLLEEMKQTVQDAEATEPLLSRRLYDAWRDAQQRRTDDALDVTRQLVEQGFLNEAVPAERVAREGIEQLNQAVQQAADTVLGDDIEALRRAQAELQELAELLNNEIAMNEPGDENQQQQNGQQQNGQRQNGQQQNGQRQNGQQQDSQQQDGQQQNGQRQNGQQQDGQQQNGQQQNGQQQNGQQQNGQQQNGQQQDGQQQNGQRQNGQQQDGQQQNGQQQNGQQQNGQQQNGQQQDGQQQNGQQQNGQQNGQRQNGQQQDGQQQNGQRQNGQRQNGQQQDGQQQDGQQQDGQQQNGQPNRSDNNQRSRQANEQDSNGLGGLAELFNDGNRPFQPLTGPGFRDWSDRLRDVEEMLNSEELRDDVARIRDRARGVREAFKRHSQEPQWPLVREQIARPLSEVLERIADEVTRRQRPDQIGPIDRDPVPAEFTERVQRYYEEIGRGTDP